MLLSYVYEGIEERDSCGDGLRTEDIEMDRSHFTFPYKYPTEAIGQQLLEVEYICDDMFKTSRYNKE